MLRLQRPIVARIVTITDWPLILIDLERGGRHWAQLSRSPAGDVLSQRRRRALVRVWAAPPALRRTTATGCGCMRPQCGRSGGTARGGGFAGLKLRLGAERLANDLATLNAVRQAARRSLHFVGYGGLAMIAASGLRHGRYRALQAKACDLVMPVFMRIGGIPISTHPHRGRRPHATRFRDRPLAGMAELGRSDPPNAIRGARRTAGRSRTGPALGSSGTRRR